MRSLSTMRRTAFVPLAAGYGVLRAFHSRSGRVMVALPSMQVLLEARGFLRVDSDAIVRERVLREAPIKAAIRGRFLVDPSHSFVLTARKARSIPS